MHLCFSRRHRRHPSAGEGSRAAARLLVPARQRQHPLRTCRRSSAATATSARLPAEERWCRRRRARRAPTVGGSGSHPALRHRPPTRRGRRLALHCRPPTRCRAAAQIAARVQPKPRPPPPPPHPGAPPTAGPSHRRSAAAPSTGAAASYPLGSHGRLLPARLTDPHEPVSGVTAFFTLSAINPSESVTGQSQLVTASKINIPAFSRNPSHFVVITVPWSQKSTHRNSSNM